MDGSGRRRLGPRLLLALAVVYAVVAAALVVAVTRSPSHTPAPSAVASATPTSPVTPSTPTVSAAARATPAADREAALAAIVGRRTRAVADHDRAAFLADVDPAATAFRREQVTLFDNVALLAPTTWRYEPGGDGPTLPSDVSARLGGKAALVRVLLHYRLAPYDAQEVTRERWLTLVERQGRWWLAGDSDGPLVGEAPDLDVWDLGPVAVARGKHCVVVARTDGRAGSPLSYVRYVDTAVARVHAVWTAAWSGGVVVAVPATQDEMGRLLGEDAGSLGQIAAVTTGKVSGPVGPTSADRVVINPATFSGLAPVGKSVVLTHEVTHVATRAWTTARLPLWLSEGFADYIGYKGSGVSVRVAASDVLADARRGRLPRDLPTDEAFDPSQADISPAYEQSWLALRMVAERYGQTTLVKLFATAAASGEADPQAAVDTALHDVLHTDAAGFAAQWRTYITKLAGR